MLEMLVKSVARQKRGENIKDVKRFVFHFFCLTFVTANIRNSLFNRDGVSHRNKVEILSFLLTLKKHRIDMAISYMTKEGYKKKMEELAYLENVKRPEISAAIAEARDKGDLSENAEYDAAKEAQGMLEMKISQLKDIVANARIIDESKLNTDVVSLLSTVKIKNVKNGMVLKYTIVSESEANLKEMKIASATPIARGLMGHKVGDVVEVKAPAGLMQFEILEISLG